MISAGGTGGGVYPALAVVEALDKDIDVLWVGGIGGMEADLVTRAGLRFEAIPAAGLHGVGLRTPANLVRLMKGIFAARKIIRSYRPDVVFFTGGYVGFPVAAAGWRIPGMAYVPDIEPGLALKWISRVVDRIAVTTSDSIEYFKAPDRVVTTGYPVRRDLQVDRQEAREILNLVDSKPVLLVFGGSRGARSINEALWKSLPQLLDAAQVVHITGSLDWPRVPEILEKIPDNSGYHVYPYLHEEMPAALSAADLVVSRAGASILGEFTLLGLPSVLVPYPHAWRYQKTNAGYLVEHGAAVQLDDERLQEELVDTVLGLLNDDERLGAMSESAAALRKPQAARAIAQELRVLAEGGSA